MTKEEVNMIIDYLKEIQENYIEGNGYVRIPLTEWYVLDKAIQAIEQITWIPVSERLPEENGWYQCTVISDNLSMTMDLYYKSGKWLDNRRIDMYNVYDVYGYGKTTEKHKLSYQEFPEFDWTKNVVAWKLLSEPYNVGSDE